MNAPFRPVWTAALFLGSSLVLSQCGGGSPTAPQTTIEATPVATTPVPTQSPATEIAIEVPLEPPAIPAPGTASTFINVLGDTGWCGSPALGPLAQLFARFDGDILLAGDLAYPNGTLEDFKQCFEPSFGRFRGRMRASPGNHDYVASANAQHYFDYFGERGGPNRLGYYHYRAGEWNVFMLNSNVPIGRQSPQYGFVRQVMQQSPTRCTLAVMHHPFDSSGPNGPTPHLRDMWELIYNLGGDLVIAGHDHLYERFAPYDPSGRRDDAKGIRQFTVGTGGATLYNRVRVSGNSEILFSNYGMLRLKLDPALYEWTFIDMNGSVLDRGLTTCH